LTDNLVSGFEVGKRPGTEAHRVFATGGAKRGTDSRVEVKPLRPWSPKGFSGWPAPG